MWPFRSPRWALILLSQVLFLTSPFLAAAKLSIPAEENYLPTGSGTAESDIIARALLMPAVQVAMSEFESRGYVRRSDLDRAGVSDDSSMAIIAYEKPGMAVNSGQPFVVAVTKLKQGLPHTRVLGGLALYDQETGLTAATDAPDSQIEVTIGDMTSTAPSNYTLIYKLGFGEWLMCTAAFCYECFLSCPWCPIVLRIICCVIGAIVCIFFS